MFYYLDPFRLAFLPRECIYFVHKLLFLILLVLFVLSYSIFLWLLFSKDALYKREGIHFQNMSIKEKKILYIFFLTLNADKNGFNFLYFFADRKLFLVSVMFES